MLSIKCSVSKGKYVTFYKYVVWKRRKEKRNNTFRKTFPGGKNLYMEENERKIQTEMSYKISLGQAIYYLNVLFIVYYLFLLFIIYLTIRILLLFLWYLYYYFYVFWPKLLNALIQKRQTTCLNYHLLYMDCFTCLFDYLFKCIFWWIVFTLFFKS